MMERTILVLSITTYSLKPYCVIIIDALKMENYNKKPYHSNANRAAVRNDKALSISNHINQA